MTRPGVQPPLPTTPARHGRRPVPTGGDFVPARGQAPAHPVRSPAAAASPVMSMLRTLQAEGFDGEIAFITTPALRPKPATEPNWPPRCPGALHGYTRAPGGELDGRFGPEHLQVAMPIRRRLRVRAARTGRGGARTLPERLLGELCPGALRGARCSVGWPNQLPGQRHRRARRRTSPPGPGRGAV